MLLRIEPQIHLVDSDISYNEGGMNGLPMGS